MLGFRPLPRTLAAAERDLDERNPQARLGALRDLARLARDGEAGARAALCRALTHADAVIRGEAAVALADAEVTEGVEPLLAVADRDAHTKVRQMALLALGELAPSTPELRERAARLAEAATTSGEPELRFQGLIALGRLDPDALDHALSAAFDDADAQVRYIAVRLADERVRARPEAELSPAVTARLHAALDDAAPAVRLAAAVMLVPRGDAAAVAVLVQALEGALGPLDAEDEQAAIELAGERGIAAAIPALRRHLGGLFGRGRFAWNARIALARLGDAAARKALLGDLGAFTRDGRTLAAVAVGRAGLREAVPRLQGWLSDADQADPDAVREALARLSAEPGA